MSLLKEALAYAQMGWFVFPCNPLNKHPLTLHGFKDASVDPAVIGAWWTHWPYAMIAVATGAASRICVLDVDVDAEERIDGEGSLKALLSGEELPPTLCARTPRGGRHFYFDYPTAIEIRNSASRLGLGLDVRGEGGSIIVPPSINGALNKRYEWDPGWAPLYPAPQWMFPPPRPEPMRQENRIGTAVASNSYLQTAVEKELNAVAYASQGRRNDQLNRSAYCLFRFVFEFGASAEAIEEGLLAAAEHAGLTKTEAIATVRSARHARGVA